MELQVKAKLDAALKKLGLLERALAEEEKATKEARKEKNLYADKNKKLEAQLAKEIKADKEAENRISAATLAMNNAQKALH